MYEEGAGGRGVGLLPTYPEEQGSRVGARDEGRSSSAQRRVRNEYAIASSRRVRAWDARQ